MQNNEKKRKMNATMNNNVKYLNPKADLTFKLVFGEHPDLVMSLLNALLPLADNEQITHVEYINPELVPENPAKKNSVVDVRCYDQQLYAYEQFWDAVINEQVLIEGGYKKGLAEGEAKRAEERLANAKALLENNVPLEVIVKSLGLTDQEAATLRS